MKEEYPPHVAAAIERAIAGEKGGAFTIGKQRIVMSPTQTFELKTRGRLTKPRGMTGIEAAYEAQLLIERAAGEVLWYRFEGITLKLADDTRYTPDFFVMLKDAALECYEIKGPYRREDSFVKLKVAASIYPFRFYLVTRDADGKWDQKEVRG